MNAFKTPFAIQSTFCLALSLSVATGCQNGPVIGRMQQYQLENERLLSEFRSQKKENEQLRADRSKLLQQQAETEKLAAKLQSQLNGGKSLTAQNSFGRNELESGLAKGGNERPIPGIGPSKLDPSRQSPRSASNSESLLWRPIPKETR